MKLTTLGKAAVCALVLLLCALFVRSVVHGTQRAVRQSNASWALYKEPESKPAQGRAVTSRGEKAKPRETREGLPAPLFTGLDDIKRHVDALDKREFKNKMQVMRLQAHIIARLNDLENQIHEHNTQVRH